MITSVVKWIFVVFIFVIVLVIVFTLFSPKETKHQNAVDMSVGRNEMVAVEDIEVGYRIYGEGQPLILIMGYGSTMNLWEDSFLESLSEHFKVIIFDNRGIGVTSTGEKKFSIEQFSKDTLGLLNALGIKKAHVLGWSMGSYIAQELASRNPDRVNKLILYASAPNPTMFPPSSDVLAKLEDTSGTPEEQGARWIGLLFPEKWIENNGKRVQEIFYRPMGTILPENIGKQSMAIGEWKGLEERLSLLPHHTLLVAGKEDVLVPPANSLYLKEKLPKSDIELIEGTGHGFMFQEPTQFLQLAIEFLKK